MSIRYRVKTKHTKELLKDFVKFSFRVNHPKATARLGIIGVGFLIIGTGMKQGSLAMWLCLVFGAVFCVLACTRDRIGVMQLKKNDKIYQNDWEVDTSFLMERSESKIVEIQKGFRKVIKKLLLCIWMRKIIILE